MKMAVNGRLTDYDWIWCVQVGQKVGRKSYAAAVAYTQNECNIHIKIMFLTLRKNRILWLSPAIFDEWFLRRLDDLSTAAAILIKRKTAMSSDYGIIWSCNSAVCSSCQCCDCHDALVSLKHHADHNLLFFDNSTITLTTRNYQ